MHGETLKLAHVFLKRKQLLFTNNSSRKQKHNAHFAQLPRFG